MQDSSIRTIRQSLKSQSISEHQFRHDGGIRPRLKGARWLPIYAALVCLFLAQSCFAWHFQGVVWYDTNQNGTFDSKETGVSGLTVRVLNCTNGALVFSTVTSSNGSFSVTDNQVPLNGDYEVGFTNLPAGYIFTKQIYPPPTNGTLVSTVNPASGYAPCFVFNQLTNDTLNNAGLIRATTTSISPLTSFTECPGNPVTFSTTASGTGPFSYAWFFNGTKLNGQTNSTLTIPNVSVTNAGSYSVLVSGMLNSMTNTATLIVSTNVTATPLTSLAECSGSPATFSTTASGTGPISYVWRFNGTLLSGQTNHSFSVASVSTTNAGNYAVEVYGSCNSVTNTATLTVNTQVSATALTSLTECSGSPATFSTTASGTGPFSYVWRFNGTMLTGQTNHSLSIASVSTTNAGTYAVEVYGSCNSVTNTATLTVNTSVSATPLTPLTECSGSPATFSTTSSGTGPFSYVWRFNGSLLSGQTNNTLSIASASTTNAGNYAVEVYGSCNSVTNKATLAVNPPTTATPLANLLVNSGASASFSTAAAGTGPFSYVWRRNGGILAGQTNRALTFSSVNSSNTGTYAVEVYGSCNSVTNTATLEMIVPPTITLVSPTNGATFIALANLTLLAQVQDADSTVTNLEFYAMTNVPGVTNFPAATNLFVPTNAIGSSTGSPYFLLWTNVTPGVYYLGARGTDALGAVGFSQIIMITVLDQPPVTATGPMVFNPQTDLFQQTVTVTNPTYYTYNGVRLLIGNLPSQVSVYNATGTTNGTPFVQSTVPIPPGGSVNFTIEYYVLSRIAPNPVFTVQLVSQMSPLNVSGTVQPIQTTTVLPDKSMLLQFSSLSNRVYYIQYSSDMVNWSTSVPDIAGTGNVISWIDNGPPVTATPPSSQPNRFYRLILLP